MKDLNLTEIEAQMAEIDKKLAGYQELVQRRTDLAQLRLLAVKLFGDSRREREPGKGGRTFVLDVPKKSVKNAASHSDYLRAAISKRGPMPIAEILKAVREEGWKGSGNDKVDKKRLYVVLYREKEMFRAAGNGKWGLVAQQRPLVEAAL